MTGVEGESDRSPRGQSGELEGTESDSVPRFLTVYAYVWGAKPNGRQRGAHREQVVQEEAGRDEVPIVEAHAASAREDEASERCAQLPKERR